MDKFAPATCELFGHLVFKGNKKYVYIYIFFLYELKYGGHFDQLFIDNTNCTCFR